MTDSVVTTTDLPNPFYSGKIRDLCDLGDRLLIVATDRISASDQVFPNGVPRKGEVLNRLAARWFERIAAVVPNHYISVLTSENVDAVPFDVPPEILNRSMIVKKAEPIEAECIVRGYISGTGWKDYCDTGVVCGVELREGLRESEQLDEPIFTPAAKAELAPGAIVAHDINITFKELERRIGADHANAAKLRSLAVYNYGHKLAQERGLIVADTKFEFGVRNEEVILIDEILTHDSSRFWSSDRFAPGGPQPSFDKQPIRDWLQSTGWKDGDEMPVIPSDVVAATTERYEQVYEMLTGAKLPRS